MSDPNSTPLPMATPVPALPYSIPMTRQRPGIITAIGVISILVACFSGLASLMTGCQAVGYYMMANVGRMMAANVNTAQAISTTNGINNAGAIPPAPISVSPNGLESADRQVVISTLAGIQPLSAVRSNQLDAILTTDGTSIFPTGGTATRADRVRHGVSSSYTHKGGGADDPGHTDFVTPWGTLKIYDAKADFLPANGGGVRTASANSRGDASAGNGTNSTANQNSSTTALTAAEVQTAVQKAQQAAQNKLTTAQLNALTTALQDPNQQLIAPGTAWSPIRSASVGADGSAWIMFSGGFASLDPQGKITTNNIFGNNGMPKIAVSGTACGLVMADAVVSIGLAIFLLIAGISVLGQSLAGRRLHRIFAMLKIPLCIAGTAAIGWMNFQFYSSFGGMGPGMRGMPGMAAFGWGAIVGGAGLIYPIALLIALNSRSLRDYYNAVRG